MPADRIALAGLRAIRTKLEFGDADRRSASRRISPITALATAQQKCEPKRADQIGSEEALAKAKAAKTWCEHASAHELKHDGKPWSYLLIPHDAITGIPIASN
jgi:hypothetical protein